MNPTWASDGGPRVVVNQAGYLPGWPKVALIVDGVSPTKVKVIDVRTERSVLELDPSESVTDSLSNDAVRTVDFSSVNVPGRYKLAYGSVESFPFDISPNAYEAATRLILRGFFLQRCGIKLNDARSGLTHEICHVHDATLRHSDEVNSAGTAWSAPGGWHDAGDYGKYVSTTAVAAGQLLSLYLHHRAVVQWDNLGIPESGNGIPDILDEVRVGVDWMVKMQRQDGAVYRKLSGTKWPHNMTPDADRQPRFVYGISTPDTAKFVAVLALASRIFQPFDAELAARYLKHAEDGWRFLEKHPAQIFEYKDGDDSGSGPYRATDTDIEAALTFDWDDRVWAASELYLTTRGAPYAKAFVAYARYMPYTLFEWKDPSSLGLLHFLLDATAPDLDGLRGKIRDRLIARAQAQVAKVKLSQYRVANRRVVWGSNKMTVQEGLT
ncbi:MAG: glycoside hydrolase family 9 protein, partial [Gammaproteobacteria bacterium]|nr:glycoside hydrolase family 9 protein [Gammaproteobacteria bacterium]